MVGPGCHGGTPHQIPRRFAPRNDGFWAKPRFTKGGYKGDFFTIDSLIEFGCQCTGQLLPLLGGKGMKAAPLLLRWYALINSAILANAASSVNIATPLVSARCKLMTPVYRGLWCQVCGIPPRIPVSLVTKSGSPPVTPPPAAGLERPVLGSSSLGRGRASKASHGVAARARGIELPILAAGGL